MNTLISGYTHGHNLIVEGWEASHVDFSGFVVTKHLSSLDQYAGCSYPKLSSHLRHGNRFFNSEQVLMCANKLCSHFLLCCRHDYI